MTIRYKDHDLINIKLLEDIQKQNHDVHDGVHDGVCDSVCTVSITNKL